MLISFEFIGYKNQQPETAYICLIINYIGWYLILTITIKTSVKKKLFSETFGL